jgi:glycosyltransferase involved in cell wall biosynthesis
MAIIGIDASQASKPDLTGTGRYAWNMIQELKKVIPASHRVRLYSRDPLRGELAELPPNWESVVLRPFSGPAWTYIRLTGEMLVRPPDVLFLMSHVLPLVLPRHVVKTTHDVSFSAYPEAFSMFSNLYYRLDMWRTVRLATMLTPSEFSKSEIIRYFKADPAKIAVIPLGFDARRFHPVSYEGVGEMRRRMGLTKPYFLYVGRLEKKKNIGTMIEAFRRYKEARPSDEHELILVGRPDQGYADEIRSFVGKPVMRSVRELGFVPDEDLPALYQGATAFVFATGYEGFGLPVIEAFACATAVIASNTTATPEVAGDAAILVNPLDPAAIAAAMARVADDPEFRAKLVAAGLSRSQIYPWSACATRAWQVIERLIARGEHASSGVPKVLFLSRPFGNGKLSGTGEQVVAREVHSELRKMARVDVVREYLIPPYRRVSSIIFYDYFYNFFLLLKSLFFTKYDSIVFASPFQTPFLMLYTILGKKTFVIMHDVFYDDYRDSRSWFDRYSALIHANVYRFARLIIVSSEETGAKVKALSGRKDLKVIYPGVETGFKSENDPNIADWEFRRSRVGYIGAYVPRKRTDRILELLRHDASTNLVFSFAGHITDAFQSAVTCGRGWNLSFRGRLDDKEKKAWYEEIGYLYFPTEREGFGIPLLEAMTKGVVPIVHRDADIPMILKNRCVVIDEPEEVLTVVEKFDRDQSMCEKFLRGNYEFSRRFRYSDYVDCVLSATRR